MGRTTSGDVASSECHSARVADEVEPAEVVGLAQRILLAILGLDREELGSHNLVAVLEEESKTTSIATKHELRPRRALGARSH